MQWVCYLQLQGLYAAVARKAGLVPDSKPVVILREGQVYDGSYEAFVRGLTLGSPVRQVLRDVPDAVLVQWEQLDPLSAGQAWWDECLRHTPYVDPVEPHQAFFSLPVPGDTLTESVRAEVAGLAKKASAHGFAAFVGVGTSKLVARAASQVCREGWLKRRVHCSPGTGAAKTLAFVAPGQEAEYLAPLPVEYLPLQPEAARRLSRLGIRTIGEAAQISEGEWLRQLGSVGHQVWLWSHGVDRDPVRPSYPPRQLERKLVFPFEVRGRAGLEQSLRRLAQALVKELEAGGEGCQQVTLRLEPVGKPPCEAQRTLSRLQQSAYPIQQALGKLLQQLLGEAPPRAMASLTVRLGLIGPMPWQQVHLWDHSGRSEREKRLEHALVLLQERFPSRMFGLGPPEKPSWREQMLQFIDPYRWAPGGVGT